MLELRPTCENCERKLPPDSSDARICTFECTFCAECVDGILRNVCPNCGGGFAPRPIRPANKLAKFPARVQPFHKAVDPVAHQESCAKLAAIPPEKR